MPFVSKVGCVLSFMLISLYFSSTCNITGLPLRFYYALEHSITFVEIQQFAALAILNWLATTKITFSNVNTQATEVSRLYVVDVVGFRGLDIAGL